MPTSSKFSPNRQKKAKKNYQNDTKKPPTHRKMTKIFRFWLIYDPGGLMQMNFTILNIGFAEA